MKIPGVSTQNIVNLGYSFKNIEENIFLIDNFLTDDECEDLLNFAKKSSQKEWETKYLDMLNTFVKTTYEIDSVYDSDVPITQHWDDKIIEIKTYNEEDLVLEKRLMEFFEKDLEYMCSPFNIIQRQYENSELPGHYDKFVDKTIEWAAVTYLNDNYCGGNIYFEKKKIRLKPQAKSILIFPSTEDYWHGVESVCSGPERYVIPVFIHDKTWNKN